MTPDALEARAKREEDTYSQKELPAMLRAGAEAMREVKRLRAALERADRALSWCASKMQGNLPPGLVQNAWHEQVAARAALTEKPHD